MADIGLIGAGNIGSTIARLAKGSGREVVLSNSRGPGTLGELVADLGGHVRAGTLMEAAASDIVIVTIPLRALPNLPADLAQQLSGTVVIDTMNYYPERDGHISVLDEHRTTTSEMTATVLPAARVVKGFNNIIHSHLLHLARPQGSFERSTLPIASDHADAKKAAASLMNELGYDALDVGPLAEGWRFENGQPAYCFPYAADPEALRRSVPGHRPTETRIVTADDLRAALGRASIFI